MKDKPGGFFLTGGNLRTASAGPMTSTPRWNHFPVSGSWPSGCWTGRAALEEDPPSPGVLVTLTSSELLASLVLDINFRTEPCGALVFAVGAWKESPCLVTKLPAPAGGAAVFEKAPFGREDGEYGSALGEDACSRR